MKRSQVKGYFCGLVLIVFGSVLGNIPIAQTGLATIVTTASSVVAVGGDEDGIDR